MELEKKERLQWLKNKEAELGRPLRVLHIGNIANNAYFNSKLLREIGVDSSVLCYDYYHVMGSPEWEEIFFDEKGINHNFPDWSRIRNSGYERPSWFIQGSFISCVCYMVSVQNRWKFIGKLLWFKLGLENKTFSTNYFSKLLINFSYSIIYFLFRFGWKTAESFSYGSGATAWQRISNNLKKRKVEKSVRGYFKFFIFVVFCVLAEISKTIISFEAFRVRDLPFEKVADDLCRRFADRFPDRVDKLTHQDIADYFSGAKFLSSVVDYYDVIHCYSTDVRWPLMMEQKKYIAYEHGTIRSLPFQDTALSRMVAMGYANASLIYMTNADSTAQAKLLSGNDKEIIFGLHGFDERLVYQRLAYARSLRTKTEGRFGFHNDIKVFFQAARQDWKIKGNVHVFHAIKELKNKGFSNFVVVMTEWGNDLEKAKKLVEELGLRNFVHWTPILSKTNLLHAYSCVDGVIDQFVCPCIGAVAAEVICIGETPFITRLDDIAMERFYGETMPCFNCSDADAISEAMSVIISDPLKTEQIVLKAKAWFEKVHVHTRVRDLCLKAYSDILS